MSPSPKVLAIQFKFLGDAVLLSTALQNLREHWPECELHVLSFEEARPILSACSEVDKVWGISKSALSGFKGMLRVFSKLRSIRFDRSVDFAGNDRGAIASCIVNAKTRLGRPPRSEYSLRNFCFNEYQEPRATGMHQSEIYNDILVGWNLNTSYSPPPKLTLPPSRPYVGYPIQTDIGLHIGAGKKEKEWPIEYWVELATILDQHGINVTLTSGNNPDDRKKLTSIKREVKTAEIIPTQNLEGFMSTITSLETFVSADTGPMHIAAALGVKTVSLFGPTCSSIWAPRGEGHHSLRADESCKMSSIMPEVVASAIIEQIVRD